MYGHYNQYGYKIFDEDDKLVYQAGNNPYDSSPGQTLVCDGLTAKELRQFCNQTGREIAKEQGEKWRNCIYVPRCLV